MRREGHTGEHISKQNNQRDIFHQANYLANIKYVIYVSSLRTILDRLSLLSTDFLTYIKQVPAGETGLGI
mgnify:CR=1 FL=1